MKVNDYWILVDKEKNVERIVMVADISLQKILLYTLSNEQDRFELHPNWAAGFFFSPHAKVKVVVPFQMSISRSAFNVIYLVKRIPIPDLFLFMDLRIYIFKNA